MGKGIRWRKIINDSEYFIEYESMTFFGNVLLSVNGEKSKYSPVYRKEDGYWVIFYCGSSECLLNIAKDRSTARILSMKEGDLSADVLDVADETAAAVQNTTVAGSKGFPAFEAVELNRKVRNGTGSFFTLLILSLINLPLMYGNASISFPYSIFTSMAAAGYGAGTSSDLGGDMPSVIISLSIAISIIIFYGILYYYSFRYNAMIWLSFAFLIFDAIILLGFALLSGAAGDFIIDIAFHAWILWAMLQLGIAKTKLQKAILNRIPILTDEMAGSYDLAE
ncbi:MAG: hypothetical protein ACYCYM_02025 [Saccharofermentanales bacterium]